MTNQPLRMALAGVLVAPLVLSACSGDGEPKAVPASGTDGPTSTSTSTKSFPPAPPKPSLLSGRLGAPNGRIYVAKVDNTAKAHPQVGLTKADVVYVEQVEGGVTRLAAVFSSAYPKLVGPVRSGRITDVDLLAQYGTVGLMYSGSQPKLRPALDAAKLKLVSFDDNPSGYLRVPSRPMPYDVIGNFAALRKRAGKVSRPKKVGYSFGTVPAKGRRATEVTVEFPSARLGALWSPTRHRYRLSMDGVRDMAAEGGQLGASTMVVQYCSVVPSPFFDVNGANTPLTVTVGHGKAVFFRNGKVFRGSWQHRKAARPTRYRIAGERAVFAPGQIWVALLAKGRPVTIQK